MHWWLVAALLLSSNAWGAPTIVDLEQQWDTQGVIGAPYVTRARLVAATGLRTSRPVAGGQVEVVLRKGDVERRVAGQTDADGVITLVLPTADLSPGTWHRSVHWSYAEGGGGSMGGQVEFRAASVLRLATDRPIYEPDQTLRWRLTALHGVHGRPLDGEARVRIEDPRGTRIWQGVIPLDQRGMIAGALPLGRDARRGRWTIRAAIGDQAVTEHFRFKRVELAPFSVQAEQVNRRRWRITARYPYGEPVQGTMQVKVAPLDGRPQPLRDGVGYVDLAPPGLRPVTAAITVTDGAARVGRAVITVPALSSRRPAVAFVAEPLARGRRGSVTVLTADPDGHLAGGTVEVKVGAGRWRAWPTTGAVRVPVRPDDEAVEIEARFDGHGTFGRIPVAPADAPTLRVRDNIRQRGEPVVLVGRWPVAHGPLIATMLHGDAPIGQVPVRRGADGRVRAVFPAPAVLGVVRIRVDDTGWAPGPEGEVRIGASAAVDVYVRPPELKVALQPNAHRLKPGTVTQIAVLVRDAAGLPVPGVGLAASVVDTRLLALGPLPPSLLARVRDLDTEDATAAGLGFAALLADGGAAARQAASALLLALPRDVPVAEQVRPAADRWQAERARFAGQRFDLIEAAAAWPGRLSTWDRAQGWRFVAPLHRLMPEALRADAWERPVTWAYVAALHLDYAFSGMADGIFTARADLLTHALYADPELLLAARRGGSVVGRVPDHLLRDPWGHRVRFERQVGGTTDLISAGPDGRFGTPDDRRSRSIFLLQAAGIGALGARGRGAVPMVVAGRPGVRGAQPSTAAATGPAVRKRFEGTVLWAVGVRTDARGAAELTVPLSDRITGWRVAVEAVGPDGAVGQAEAAIETFLPRFADVVLPPELAVGDRYRAHAVVTNHGPDAVLTLDAVTDGAVALAAPVQAELRLARGAARRVALPLLARAAGTGRVRLTLASADGVADRVERTLEVIAPGALTEQVFSTRVSDAAAIAYRIPPDAHAPSATLRVFRNPTDLALDGIDALLRAPHGCFEQTSSSTFPNLLVLDLLRDAEGAEEIRAKARRFVALGYQRLVSYEVAGGGFSWFGDPPANQVLTAYGVLEFGDMAKVYPVDPALIARTQAWLFAQQRADGAWAPDAKWLHDWKAVQRGALATTAWIAWTLAEAGSTDPRLDKALGWLEARMADLEPFELGLLAGAQTARGRAPTALSRLEASLQDGRIVAGRSLFSRSARTADVQATALANQAFVRTAADARAVAGLDWIWAQRTAAGWGNTQATVLALRAALAHRSEPLPPESVVGLSLDGRALAPLALDGRAVPTRTLAATRGAHRLVMRGPGEVRADLRLAWRGETPPTSPASAGLSIVARRPPGPIPVGHAAAFSVEVHNPGTGAIAMPTIEVPVPPGFRVDEARFAVKGVARAEDQGDRVVFYLERLAAGERRTLTWHLQALAEVDVLHRPATIFAYYDPDIRGRSAAARIRTRAHPRVAQRRDGPRLTAESVGLGRPSR